MMQFAELFPDIQIVSTASTQLSWSHFIELLPLQTTEERLFYLKEISNRHLGIRELRKTIGNKTFWRTENANIKIKEKAPELLNTFKDPYFLNFLNLPKTYSENDLEDAIIAELQNFILELGQGFAFVDRQKRMIIDGEDFHLDLLFFHRQLKRLVAIELKLGRFQAKYKGQMELYLKWLDRYEKQEGENEPIGLILCTEGNREQIELLDMSKNGIMVAEYWTELPSKKLLEQKIREIVNETTEIYNRKLLQTIDNK